MHFFAPSASPSRTLRLRSFAMQRYNIVMRRWLAVAALGAAFLTMPLWAQRHGGGFAGHAGFTSRGPVFSGHGAMFGNRGSFGGFHRSWGSGFRGSFYSRNWSSRGWSSRGWLYSRYRHSYPWWRYRYTGRYGYPWWGEWYGDLGGWPDYAYDSYAAEPYPAYDYTNDSYAQNDALAEQVGRLSDEVARLREERQTQTAPLTTPPAEQSEDTELVFRDRHTEQVQNYAIVGPTLWILNPQRPRKIALAELDLPATVRANQDRGVDFQLPR